MKKAQILKILIVVIIALLTWYFGFRPMLNGEGYKHLTNKDNSNNLTSNSQSAYSVIIVGEQPDAVSAAIASARTGLKTLLITEDITLGGEIADCLIAKTYQNTGLYEDPIQQKRPLNVGIYKEILDSIGQQFVPEEYAKKVKQLVDDEEMLDVMYSGGVYAANIVDERLKSISVYYNGEELELEADIFIDSTVNGDLLDLCETPYFIGSKDLNSPNDFEAVSLNFIISGVDWEEINKIKKTTDVEYLFSIVQSYKKQFDDTRITEVSFVSQPNNKVLVSGLSMADVNVTNINELQLAYKNLFYEAQMFTAFLKTTVKAFENCGFDKAAEKLYIPENKHYIGKYILKVSDVLENKNFGTKIALSARPINAGKFVESGLCYIGVPQIFSVPIDCIVSSKINNLLMTGRKASFSSLASTAVNDIGTTMTIGEAAGYTAFYCITNNISPNTISSQSNIDILNYNQMLKRLGIFLDEFNYENPNKDNIFYPAIKVLCEYGLIAGGTQNDYGLNIEATNSSFVNLLISSLYRIASSEYTLEIENILRKYENNEMLTLNKASEVLLRLYDNELTSENKYSSACKLGYIPSLLQNNPNEIMTMDKVYYLIVFNIEKYAGIDLLK